MTTETTPIASQIDEAVKDIPGWSQLDQLLTLFILACTSSSVQGDILEVGSWCGRSATALGMAARLSGNTRVHCVDLWPAKDDWYKNEDGSYSFTVTVGAKVYKAYREQTVWAEPFLRDIAPMYERFNGTLDAFNSYAAKNGLSDYIVPHRCDLTTFAENAPEGMRLRMAFIDGEHAYEAVCRDIETIERFLMTGGWICFDDAFSSWDGVDQAIRDKIIESGNYECCQQLTRKCFVARRK